MSSRIGAWQPGADIRMAPATPLTYAVVAWVKRHEGIDTYGRRVSRNPLAF